MITELYEGVGLLESEILCLVLLARTVRTVTRTNVRTHLLEQTS